MTPIRRAGVGATVLGSLPRGSPDHEIDRLLAVHASHDSVGAFCEANSGKGIDSETDDEANTLGGSVYVFR
jgi:hypothetical protein